MKSKRTKKMMKVRGGFIVPSGGGKRPKFKVVHPPKSSRTRNPRVAFIQGIKREAYGFLRSEKFTTWATAKAMDLAGDAVNKIKSGQGLFTYKSPGSNNTVTSLPGIKATSVRLLTGANGTYKSKLHKTKIEFGKKTSYAAQLAAKQNGTTMTAAFVSDIDNASANLANQLTANFGFNQKAWWFPTNNFFPSNLDITNLFGETAAIDSESRYRIYGMCMEEHLTYRIYNSNTYFPVNVKISICTALDADQSSDFFKNQLVSANLTQAAGRIPVRYQFEAPVENTSQLAHVDPKVSYNDSANFREHNIINTTDSQKLYPGDCWEIKMIRHTGPGWDLLKQKAIADSPGVSPIQWFPLIEAWGVQCEGVDTLVGKRVLGLSPGDIKMECRKSFKMINTSSELSNAGITGGNTTKYLVRAFRERDYTSTLYHVPPQNISHNFTSSGFFIPVISDKLVQYSGPTTD